MIFFLLQLIFKAVLQQFSHLINQGKTDFHVSCSLQIPVLTNAWYDVELVVDLLVHSGGDDADFGEGIGH